MYTDYSIFFIFQAKYDGISITQPENAIKKITSDYAEFTIPGGKKGDVEDMELIKVSSLDTTGKLVFRDIKEFNRIQSEVFPVAYHSNENMLICAPTGAGKTNIALLSIVHQIKSHMEGNLIRKNDFKVIKTNAIQTIVLHYIFIIVRLFMFVR